MSLFTHKLPTHRQLQKNTGRIYALAFCELFLLVIPIAVPFFQSKGLSMQQFFLLQAIFGAVIAVAEIPSGYMADLWGRRNTLLLGALFYGVGYSILLFADGFWSLMLFEVCVGIGTSLISGADIALLYDTKNALGASPVVQSRSVANLFFVCSVSEAGAAVLCSILLLWSIDLVILCQVIVGWLPLLFALCIVEPPTDRLPTHSHWDNFYRIGRILIYENNLMRLIVLGLVFWSLTVFYAVWLLQKYWENIGVPLAWFGYLWAAYAVIAGLSGRYADRVEIALGAPLMLFLVGALPILGYLGMAWVDSLISLAFTALFFIARGLGLVTLRAALNQRIPGIYRATANSIVNFGFRGSFAITGPILGWILDLWSMDVALYAAAAYSALVLVSIILPLGLTAFSMRRQA